ncbi:ATP-binding cassette domain-containing protein [Selenomonas sp. TAMA-11512]|uniref:ABC transporter ATP-binding protein n=1 Tax=Selenomonas sp. TAMA-11512 TaxID=3095337 RepID=UPI00308BF37B|nr:ATP-binding cassette domain-containing protein [Selenomonas sp. TAMA-11512]
MIELSHLTRTFQRKDGSEKVAVSDLSLSIKEGEIFALLGPNGAGKTTTIRMLTMLLTPTSGTITYDGFPLTGNELELKKHLGVVPQHINFDQDLSVEENMQLFARLYRIPPNERMIRIKELLNYVELTDVAKESTRTLSGGMKRRLLIARALLHRPSILVLDEPTVALDPQVRRLIWSLIRKLASDGAAVLLTTHYIEEAEALASRVAILDHGKCVALATPDAIKHMTNSETLEDAFIALTGKRGNF